MKLFLTQIVILLLIMMPFKGQAQIQAMFNNKSQLRNMTERWELDSTVTRGTFLVTPYKPIYILPTRWSSNPNEKPVSGNPSPDYISQDGLNYNNIEARFQLSFKTKVAQDIFWGKGDLWVAYTQVSHWQLYNNTLSRPFREINYEPEVILNFPVNLKLFGFKMKMAGVAFNHESNGKSQPLSRSWNRVIFHAGFEKDRWSVYIRPWLKMKATKDDNPDISEYLGYGDINVIYARNGNIFSFQGNHNLRLNSKSKGGATFSWAYPIKDNLKGHLLISQGYGETLVDYNNKQTTIGVGISLIEWL
ncbi:phospholipase A [Flavobacterium sp. 14A]|uniref:phospholipase A n=1 Tax=Flavobacterium sp. 14A TaxID=2735896 RepID=UPI00157107E1|nr:phospholipase A [Flavobacterium sp. 14A]NRT11966.1 phospholipase A1 [Flavobacterium sp. 14A]